MVWFIVRDGRVPVSIDAKRQKTRNLQANAEVSFLITHPDTDDYFAEIRGTAQLVPDHDDRLADARSAHVERRDVGELVGVVQVGTFVDGYVDQLHR